MANYLPNLPVKLKIARGKLEKYAREKFKIARGKSQKYARDQNNCPWQISKSKSFTGKKKFHGGKKKHCPPPHGKKITDPPPFPRILPHLPPQKKSLFIQSSLLAKFCFKRFQMEKIKNSI